MENKKFETHQDLVVWQMSHELAKQVFVICRKLRKDEGKHLAQLMRAAATQIPINIALGFKKRGKETKVHYYRNALAFLEEISYYLQLGTELGHLKGLGETPELIENLEKKMKGLLRSFAGPH
jgi:four helix bundle protein